jgi:predicted ATP-dependent protease
LGRKRRSGFGYRRTCAKGNRRKSFPFEPGGKENSGFIANGTLLIDVEGAVVGQVNGLAVYQMGDFNFGKPSRITARTFLGRGGIVNIERKPNSAAKLMIKGIDSQRLPGRQICANQPLALAISICFEQSYEGVDGDSASSTELYAILSSLAGFPSTRESR